MVFIINPVVPGYIPLLVLVYNYNSLYVLSFVTTEGEAITKFVMNYLSHYPDQFANVAIWPTILPLIMYKFFESVNKIYSHKKFMLSNLALEKHWVIHCGWIYLCNTVAIGITFNIFGKYFIMGLREKIWQMYLSFMGSTTKIQLICTIVLIFPLTSLIINIISLIVASRYPVVCHQTLFCPTPLFVHSILL